ncbi:MAG TPA: (Fe-S)-binding protein [bacterium]|jgi:glycolate oxidase iron-sulfur subunit
MEKELSPHAKAAAIELAKCTSCGMCKDVCPTFVLTRLEAESARGKVNLLKALLEESLDPAEASVDIFNRCLLCYACQDACPAGVQTSKIWISAREILGDEVGRPFSKSFFLQRILPKPGRLHLAMALSRGFPGDEFSVRLGGRNLPRPAGNRLDKLLPEMLEPAGRPRGTVAFFPGCMISDVYPQLGVQAAEILTHLGYRVITPRARVCCGAPAFNNGDMGTARGLAERNIELFNALEVDAVVSPDATCGGAFVHEYDMLFPNGSQWRSAFLTLREKTVNYAEFIEKAISEQPMISFRPLPYKLTVHDSCHLKYLQQKSHIPRQLLDYIPDLEVLESPQSGLCCGFGGSYSILFPNESRAITRRKLDYLKQSGSNVVMVGSPGCLWKLRAEAAQLRLNLRIVHYVEILWESLIGKEAGAVLDKKLVGVGATPTME